MGRSSPVMSSVRVNRYTYSAEHADKIVAGTAGEMGDGHVGEQRRAVYALVEGAVAAAGVDAQVATVLRLGPYFAHGVHGRGGDVYLKLRRVPRGGGQTAYGLVYQPQLVLRLYFAGDGVDYEEVLHLFTLPALLGFLTP